MYIYITDIYKVGKNVNVLSWLLPICKWCHDYSCTWADDVHDMYYTYCTSVGFEHSVCYESIPTSFTYMKCICNNKCLIYLLSCKTCV